MSSSKHFQVTIDPGEKYYLFSQSALDEMIANYINAELEKAAERAWMALVGKQQGWEVRQAVSDAIRARGNVTSAE